jgi:hypothetical protein
MKSPGPFHIDTVRLVLTPEGDGVARPVTPDFYEALGHADMLFVTPGEGTLNAAEPG